MQSLTGPAACPPAITRRSHQSYSRAPSSRRMHRAQRASALPVGSQLYLTADADVLDSKQSKEGLLQALLERANTEAQRRSGGPLPDSSGTSQGPMPPASPSAADEVLDRIPGNERMTSGVAELIEGSKAASDQLRSMMEGVLPPPSASGSGSSGGKASVLDSINFRQTLEGVTSSLKALPDAIKQGQGSLLQGNPLESLGKEGGSAMESITAAPSRLSASLGAAADGAHAQLDNVVQAVGAVVLPGESPSSSQLLESRRAAGHLVDLTPIYKAWSSLVQPFAFFGDRWLLNILFIVVFVLLSFTLLAKAPRQ